MNNKVKMLLVGLILVIMFSMAANAYQGNYKICWLTRTGKTRECGSCMFETKEQARKVAERINKETGDPQMYAIRKCDY